MGRIGGFEEMYWLLYMLDLFSRLLISDVIYEQHVKKCNDVYYRPQTKLGQGNNFTGVCLSIGGRGVSLTENPPLDRDPLVRDLPGQRPPRMEMPLDRDPPYSKKRAVRILLECILVPEYF